MVRAYYYLFYRLYTFAKWARTGVEEWTAMLFVSILNYFNFTTIVFAKFPIEKVIVLPIGVMSIIICVPLMVLNYFIFLNDGKVDKIVTLFENESKPQKVISSFLTVGYVVATLVLAHW